ncbi:MAG TPA: hypothetical protein VHF47_10675 [Acidimicrobiales bacterium]|nr:hypothetical protein [Acidimicrobiales bacterium]
MRLLAAALALSLATAPAHAHPDDPFHEGREAAERLSFTALAVVRWVDEGGEHEATVEVDARNGEVRINGPREVVAHAESWTRLWTGAQPPPVELKYDLLRGPEVVVAGRPSTTVEVWAGDALRERVALDRATGLVLHREQLGRDGEPQRVVTVQRFELVEAGAGASGQAGRARTMRPERLPRMYRAPVALAGGYRQLAAYRDGEGVHLLYSDGLHGISVFAQPGRVPDGGRPVQVGRWAGRRFAWPGGEAVAWERGGLVYTLVGDGPHDELVAAASSMPGPPRLSVVGRLKRACRAMAELVGA